MLDHPSGVTLDELAAHLKVTKTAAKEHLIKIDRLGYLSFQDQQGLVGRPRRFYFLTNEGHEAFPRQYSWLSNLLLAHLSESIGPLKTSKMMKELAEHVVKSMGPRFQNKKSSADLLAEITKALNELGYRAQLKQSDLRKGASIEATNCVYHALAKNHPELCHFDIQFIEKASGNMNVKLECCISRGDALCRFRLRKL